MLGRWKEWGMAEWPMGAKGGHRIEERSIMPRRGSFYMVHIADKAQPPRSSDGGRILTPEEADFLRRFLLESDPVVVTGDIPVDKTNGGAGVPRLKKPRRLVD